VIESSKVIAVRKMVRKRAEAEDVAVRDNL
jgi:hypothetical protein